MYEAQINGHAVGDHVLDPGWTSYNHRLRYQTFDVTHLLREGPNAIGAMLGDGWYRGRLDLAAGHRNIYGDRLALLAQLEIRYADGTTDRIVTDDQWRAASGRSWPATSTTARPMMRAWSAPAGRLPGYDDHDWAARSTDRARPGHAGRAHRAAGAPDRAARTGGNQQLAVGPHDRRFRPEPGRLVAHHRPGTGGNGRHAAPRRGAGRGRAGHPAAALCRGHRPLHPARAAEPETWEPRFTFHGFRYAEVEGWPGELRPDDIRAVVCHSDMERTGWFECSDPLLNRLHENVVWSMRGNFLDLPTDCPQRDERLGWTGDIEVFAPTASFLYDSAGFLQSWLADLAAEQAERRRVSCRLSCPMSCLRSRSQPPPGVTPRDCALGAVPALRRCRHPGRTNSTSMRAWVDLVAGLAGEDRLWDEGFQFGDWLDPSAPPDRPAEARTDPFLVATAYFARSAELVGQAARRAGPGGG